MHIKSNHNILKLQHLNNFRNHTITTPQYYLHQILIYIYIYIYRHTHTHTHTHTHIIKGKRKPGPRKLECHFFFILDNNLIRNIKPSNQDDQAPLKQRDSYIPQKLIDNETVVFIF